MPRIEVCIFQIPSITLDGQPVKLPFKRADALFYYLVCKKSATRQELVGLLWSETPEDVAYKNLRHTIYTLRKYLGAEVVLTPRKTEVALNPAYDLHCDFTPEGTGGMEVDCSQFLRGFSVKNAPAFNDWVDQMRDSCNHQALQSLIHAANEALREGDSDRAEGLAQKYLSIDGLDEKMVMFLMRLYQQNGQYYKAVQLYQKLKSKLQVELGIPPLHDTTALYYEVVNRWNTTVTQTDGEEIPPPIGRSEILQQIQGVYKDFLQSYGAPPLLMLYGNVGSGKSYIIQHFLKAEYVGDVLLLVGNCFRRENDGYLEAWKSVMVPLAEYVLEHKLPLPEQTRKIIAQVFPVFSDGLDRGSQAPQFYRDSCDDLLMEGVTLLLSIVARRKKILLVFENLHWMDRASQQLLIHVVRRLNGGQLMALVTSRTPDTDLCAALREKELLRIEVPGFSREETREFCRSILDFPLSPSLEEQVFDYTGGNPKLIADLVQSLKRSGGREFADTSSLLHQRLAGLSQDARDLCNIISLFQESAPCNVLSALTGKGPDQLYDIYEELRQNDLVEEFTTEGEGYIAFLHPGMGQAVCGAQSYFRRQPLHLSIARQLEGMLFPQDGRQYLQLAYHYARAGEHARAFGYRVRCLELYTQRRYDLIPVQHDSPCTVLPDGMEIEAMLRQLEEEYRQLARGGGVSNEHRYILQCAKARYLIFIGRYQEGLAAVNHLLEGYAEDLAEYPGLLLDVLQQLITYNFRVDQLDPCGVNITRGLEIAERNGLAQKRVNYLFLKGMYCCRCGAYDSCEYYLSEVQEQLKGLPGQHQMLLALCHTWLGESRRYRKDFSAASAEYKLAVDLLSQASALPGGAFTYTCYGRAALALEDHYKAAALFAEALELFQKTGELPGRSLAQAYLAYYAAKDEQYERATELLVEAKQSASKLSSLQEQGVRDSVLARLRRDLDAGHKTDNALHRYLYRTLDIYCNRGIQRLRDVTGAYELEELERCLQFSKNQGPPLRVENLYSKNKRFMTE